MNIVLAVTGGIAAYKAPEIVRRLRERGCTVRPVMTEAARAFITPLSLQAVSGHEVPSGLLDPAAEAGMGHIELARWADLVLVAPASADFMARIAHGLADDLPSTLCLATTAPVVLAPAMNHRMWLAAATLANRHTLEQRGVRLIGPGEGDQACGEYGPGRMLEPQQIADLLLAPAADGPLLGRRVLVTAGPTREALDPVRYITNHSSGKMGYAVARAARAAGAAVTLVSGPTSLPAPAGVERVDVESAEQMLAAVLQRVDEADVFIGAAAVADYRPLERQQSKMKKSGAGLMLEMTQNPDIIATVTARTPHPFTVGFAAETDDVERHAKDKLSRKRLDMIAANRVGVDGRGFNADDNALSVFWPGGGREFGLMSKEQLAARRVALVAERLGAQR